MRRSRPARECDSKYLYQCAAFGTRNASAGKPPHARGFDSSVPVYTARQLPPLSPMRIGPNPSPYSTTNFPKKTTIRFPSQQTAEIKDQWNRHKWDRDPHYNPGPDPRLQKKKAVDQVQKRKVVSQHLQNAYENPPFYVPPLRKSVSPTRSRSKSPSKGDPPPTSGPEPEPEPDLAPEPEPEPKAMSDILPAPSVRPKERFD